MSEDAVARLTELCENQDYYEVMDTTVEVETTDIDFAFHINHVDISSVGAGWTISKGVETIHFAPLDSHARFQRTDENHRVTAVEIQRGVGDDA